MQLDAQEETLVEAFRRLPAEVAGELSALVQRVAAAASAGTRIDWSDSWSDKDLGEFTEHSLTRFDAEESQ